MSKIKVQPHLSDDEIEAWLDTCPIQPHLWGTWIRSVHDGLERE